MPRRPLKPCSYPGCPNLTEGSYCVEHQAHERARTYIRDPRINKRYDSRWRKIRNAFLAAHPLCAECERAGRIVAATEVDHITPLSQGGTHAEENLQALCHSCHSKKTAKEDGRWTPKTYEYLRSSVQAEKI